MREDGSRRGCNQSMDATQSKSVGEGEDSWKRAGSREFDGRLDGRITGAAQPSKYMQCNANPASSLP